MKKSRPIIDIVLLVSLGLVALLSIAPQTVVMTSRVQMVLLGVVLALLAIFLLLVWREQPADEREALNQAQASRVAYVLGTTTLILFLVVGSLKHSLDPAIPITLLVMISTKLLLQVNKDES